MKALTRFKPLPITGGFLTCAVCGVSRDYSAFTIETREGRWPPICLTCYGSSGLEAHSGCLRVLEYYRITLPKPIKLGVSEEDTRTGLVRVSAKAVPTWQENFIMAREALEFAKHTQKRFIADKTDFIPIKPGVFQTCVVCSYRLNHIAFMEESRLGIWPPICLKCYHPVGAANHVECLKILERLSLPSRAEITGGVRGMPEKINKIRIKARTLKAKLATKNPQIVSSSSSIIGARYAENRPKQKGPKKKRARKNGAQRKRATRALLDAGVTPTCLKPPPNIIKPPKQRT